MAEDGRFGRTIVISTTCQTAYQSTKEDDPMCTDGEGGGCGLDRRDFLKAGAASVAGLGALGAGSADYQIKQPPTRVLDDPRVEHGKVMFKHADKETFDGYLARPRTTGTFPGVLVIPGNLITEEYIPNTCAALALAGFVGLAPNIFHPLPANWPVTRFEGRGEYIKNHNDYDILEDIQVAADYLKTLPYVRGRGFGMVGFCYGGWISLQMAARSREVRAVVAYHPGIGTNPDAHLLNQVRAPVQLHQGTADQSIDPKSAIKLRDIFKAHDVPVELFMYKGADHGFTSYTRDTYRPDYAKLAWSRTIKFLSRHFNEN
jgi:carboxymethylenebutenolidase